MQILSNNDIFYQCLFFLQKLKKELKKYQKTFEIKDRMSQSRASKVCLVFIIITVNLYHHHHHHLHQGRIQGLSIGVGSKTVCLRKRTTSASF
jgi:hypothetical protein